MAKSNTNFLAIAMSLTGCTASVNAAAAGESVALVAAESEDSDVSYDASKAVTIQLTDSKVSVSGKGVKVSGQVVTITEPGTYVVSGTLKAGQLIVATDKEEKVHLI